MKKLALFLLLLTLSSSAFSETFPEDWNVSGRQKHYDVSLDNNVSYSDPPGSFSIKSISPETEDYRFHLMVMKNLTDKQFNGKRVKYSAHLKVTDKVKNDLADFFIQAFDANGLITGGKQSISFESSNGEWTVGEVIMDIPTDTKSIVYGFQLNGSGQFWVDGINLEAVDNSVSLKNVSIEQR